jgi:hypothetical protein
MFNFLRNFWRELTIAGLVIIVIYLSNIFGNRNDEFETIRVNGEDYELLSQEIDTVVVEKEVKVTEYVPQTVYRTDTVQVQIPSDVDTTAILEDYFVSYTVIDTLKLDYDFPDGVTTESGTQPSTLGYGVLTDILSQNKIQSRKVDWTFQIPTIYNTTIVKELPKNEFYLGGSFGYNEEDVFGSAGLGLGWKTKKQRLLILEGGVTNDTYGTLTEYNPYLEFSYFVKLGK